MPNEKNTRRVPVGEQPKDRLYEMTMRFVADAGVAELDDLARMAGMPSQTAKDAVTVRVTQVVSFIPDEETIAKYEAAILAAQNEGDSPVRLRAVRFDGYESIHAVEIIKTRKESANP